MGRCTSLPNGSVAVDGRSPPSGLWRGTFPRTRVRDQFLPTIIAHEDHDLIALLHQLELLVKELLGMGRQFLLEFAARIRVDARLVDSNHDYGPPLLKITVGTTHGWPPCLYVLPIFIHCS